MVVLKLPKGLHAQTLRMITYRLPPEHTKPTARIDKILVPASLNTYTAASFIVVKS